MELLKWIIVIAFICLVVGMALKFMSDSDEYR